MCKAHFCVFKIAEMTN